MESIRNGVPYRELEIRIANSAGHYVWCRVRATTQFDRNRNPIKAVGVILDIDAEKRKTQELTAKAERDALTGCIIKVRDAIKSRSFWRNGEARSRRQ